METFNGIYEIAFVGIGIAIALWVLFTIHCSTLSHMKQEDKRDLLCSVAVVFSFCILAVFFLLLFNQDIFIEQEIPYRLCSSNG